MDIVHPCFCTAGKILRLFLLKFCQNSAEVSAEVSSLLNPIPRLITPMSGSGIVVYFAKGLSLLFLVYFFMREIR